MSSNELGLKIKSLYENRTRLLLDQDEYIIIRIDGKNFSRYTRKLKKPFDQDLADDFDQTAKILCSQIMGAHMAYTQSDEISIVVSNFSSSGKDIWFNGNIQKIVSVSCSMATASFNDSRIKRSVDYKGGIFDSRVFTIPDRSSVLEYLTWRQKDASRNSISMIARSVMSSKEMHGISTGKIIEILKDRGIDLKIYNQGLLYGRIIFKEKFTVTATHSEYGIAQNSDSLRTRWVAKTAPNFSKEDISIELIPERKLS
jgi:tRNA(His) 5'-end guanylyltransferase